MPSRPNKPSGSPASAMRHTLFAPSECFVIELWGPKLRTFPPDSRRQCLIASPTTSTWMPTYDVLEPKVCFT